MGHSMALRECAGVSRGDTVGSEEKPADHMIAPEDRLRADTYVLLAMLLAAPPRDDLLELVGALRGDESRFGQLAQELALAAQGVDANLVEREFHDLFIGFQSAEFNPFASYYLTGALFGRPLASLRIDMAKLGIARAEDINEPEDHIAAISEMMAGLILGSFGDGPAMLSTQKAFFSRHLEPWAARFFADLAAAPAESFYGHVGRLGGEFVRIESQAFAMVD